MTLQDEILRLRSEGKTYRQIKWELKCSSGTIAYHLGDGQKEKTRQREKKRRLKINAFIQFHKESTPCADCQQSYPYYVMDFDHLPEHIKEFNIGDYKNSTTNISKIIKEIEKCDVVCSNCHRRRTHARQFNSPIV